MLEELLIFTRGGLILWSSCRALGRAALKGSPIDALIRSCLLEERSADASFSHDTYSLKWTFNNDLGLVFVVYQRMLHLLYIDDLLMFRQLHLEAEARAEAMKKSRQNTLPSSRAGGKKDIVGPRNGGGCFKKSSNAESGKDDSDGSSDSGKEQDNGLTNGSVKGHEKESAHTSNLPRTVRG